MRKEYPSDITREQFELIKESFEKCTKSTRPRTVDLYDIYCAILYLLTSGCQWRMIPKDYPKWQLVYYYFHLWSKKEEGQESLLEGLLKKNSGRNPYKGRKKE